MEFCFQYDLEQEPKYSHCCHFALFGVCCPLSDSGPTKHEAAAAVLRFFFTPYNRASALTQIFNCLLRRVEEGGMFLQGG